MKIKMGAAVLCTEGGEARGQSLMKELCLGLHEDMGTALRVTHGPVEPVHQTGLFLTAFIHVSCQMFSWKLFTFLLSSLCGTAILTSKQSFIFPNKH